MLSAANAVPQTMLSATNAVPQTMLSAANAVPQTMLSTGNAVPHTMLSPSEDTPQTRWSHATEHVVPHTMLSPTDVLAAPQVVPIEYALPRGSRTPPLSMWLPQRMCLLHDWGIVIVARGVAEVALTVPVRFVEAVAPV